MKTRNCMNAMVGMLLAVRVCADDPRELLVAEASQRHPEGARIYRDQCAGCHGGNGEGVADKYDEALYGERSEASLRKLIERTMPEDDPGKCVGEEAGRVAAWVYEAFYSPLARERLHPARVEFQHLLNRQLVQSLAMLSDGINGGGNGDGAADSGGEQGLRGVYYNDRDRKEDRRVLERTDAQVAFAFGEASPAEGIGTEAFAVSWSGSLRVPVGGEYGFRVVSANGVRLWVNAPSEGGRGRGQQAALIDGWVSSGNEERAMESAVVLPGGFAVPVRLEFFKYKEKTASVRLQWREPHGDWEDIPASVLRPVKSGRVSAVRTEFPPDDGSSGYLRGVNVSRDWQSAVADASLEVAGDLASLLARRSAGGREVQDRVLRELAGRAWRRPVSDGEAGRLRQLLESAPDEESGWRRVVLAVVQSPYFLYPESMPSGVPAGYRAASRLALMLWDGLPDAGLRRAAESGQLNDAESVRDEARRMLRSPLARVKVREFFADWLAMEEAGEIARDPGVYPDFTPGMVSDLRKSLSAFVDHVVWESSGSWRELLEADYLLLNGPLAARYGAARIPDGRQQFEKITFPASERAGVLTHPFLLSALAYYRSTSPIHRGVFLTRNLLGRFLKPPPMAIAFMDGKFRPELTMREKVAELTKNESCMACHQTINPLGFVLEGYDATGRLRYLDNGRPVRTDSEYVTVEGESVALQGPRDLARHAVESRDAQRGFVRQAFQYFTGQAVGAYGPRTLDALHAAFVESGFSIPELLVRIAEVPALHALKTSNDQKP
jgi:hypothetical protein